MMRARGGKPHCSPSPTSASPELPLPSRGSPSTRALKQTDPAGQPRLVPLSYVNLGTLLTSLMVLCKIEKPVASLLLSWNKFSKEIYRECCSNSISECFYCPVVISMCPVYPKVLIIQVFPSTGSLKAEAGKEKLEREHRFKVQLVWTNP